MSQLCEGCGTKQANFGTPTERKKRWCAACGKAHRAVNLKRQKMCEGCGTKQAGFGTPTERKKRWCGECGKTPGMQVWRIEKMVPTAVDPKEYGKFYDGDSYICLKTTEKPGHSTLTWDIYFWLGADTSKDEAGVAAFNASSLSLECNCQIRH